MDGSGSMFEFCFVSLNLWKKMFLSKKVSPDEKSLLHDSLEKTETVESGLGPFKYREQKIDKKGRKKCFSKGEEINLPWVSSPSASRGNWSVF